MDQLTIRSGEPVAQLLRSERPAVEVDRCGAIADNQAGPGRFSGLPAGRSTAITDHASNDRAANFWWPADRRHR